MPPCRSACPLFPNATPQALILAGLPESCSRGAPWSQPYCPTGFACHAQVTGAVGWRKDSIKYKKNEVFLDIVEQVILACLLAHTQLALCKRCRLSVSICLSSL